MTSTVTTTAARPATGDAHLDVALTLLRAYATEHRLPVVPGYIDNEDRVLPLVTFRDGEQWEAEPTLPESMRQFLASLQFLDVAMLVLWVDRLTRDEWEEAVDEYRDAIEGRAALDVRDDLDDQVREELPPEQLRQLEDLLARARRLEHNVGEIRTLQVRAVTRNPALMIEWWHFAPWEELVGGADRLIGEIVKDETKNESSEVLARQEEWMALERERKRWTPAKRSEAARRLAELPEFANAKREADRVYLLRKMLGEEAPADDYMTKEIAREAHAIYSLEIKPKR